MLLLDQHTGASQNHTAYKTRSVALSTLWTVYQEHSYIWLGEAAAIVPLQGADLRV